MAAPPVMDISSSPSETHSRVAPSSHRLATVSASDALKDLENTASSFVSTVLPSLDAAVAGSPADSHGGLERGKVTEIWGPKGAGTTAMALQASASALRDNRAVVWVDCASSLSQPRVTALLGSDDCGDSAGKSPQDRRGWFRHLSAPTLSHLLAFVLHPPPDLVADGTALLAIDNLNILMDLDYPRAQAIGSNRTEAQKWQAGRRYTILGSLVTALNKLAALNNLAVIVTTGCAMRSRPDSGLGGALAPGIGGTEWDAGVWNRLVVFRDIAGRFVGVQKCGGKSLIPRDEIGEPGRIIGFDISPQNGTLRERQPGQAVINAFEAAKVKSSPIKSRKRYIDEVADSDGEDEYGWDAGDEEVFASNTLRNEPSTTNDRANPIDVED